MEAFYEEVKTRILPFVIQTLAHPLNKGVSIQSARQDSVMLNLVKFKCRLLCNRLVLETRSTREVTFMKYLLMSQDGYNIDEQHTADKQKVGENGTLFMSSEIYRNELISSFTKINLIYSLY